MKRIALALLLFISLNSIGCAQSNGTIKAVEFDKVIKAKKELQLIDVRTLNEYKEGHIKGAVNIDLYSPNFKQLMGKLDQTKPIAVYCAVGGRSASTARMIQQMGFKEVYDLQGGIVVWQKEGYQVVKN